MLKMEPILCLPIPKDEFMTPEENVEARLSIQRALLDVVTPSLRQVSFQLDNYLIKVHFIYDSPITELENELMGDAAAEIISDFSNAYNIEWEGEVVEPSKKIRPAGFIVFNRYEGF